MSATPRTDALEKAVSLGMVGSQLFAEVRKMEKDFEAMTEGLKIASVAVENLRHEVNAHRNAAMEADLRTQAAVRGEKMALALTEQSDASVDVLLEALDSVLELCELNGMHSEGEYQRCKAIFHEWAGGGESDTKTPNVK